MPFWQFIEKNMHIIIGGILFLLLVIIIVVIVLILPSNKKIVLLPENIPNQLSSNEYCSNCNFLKNYYGDTIRCQNSPEQNNSITNCSNKFCMNGLESIYKNCFAPNREECDQCQFSSVLGTCVDDAVWSIPNMDFDNQDHRFLLKMYISNNCSSCIPSDYDIDVLKKMVSRNRILSDCGDMDTQRCPEVLDLVRRCIGNTREECENCQFMYILANSCSDVGGGDGAGLMISNNCGCSPTDYQMDIYNSLLENDRDKRECVVNNNCPETSQLVDECTNNTPPTSTEPPVTYPPVDNYCSDCSFLDNLGDGSCLTNVLLGGTYTTSEERDYYIYNSCGCGLTDAQSGALTGMLENNIDFGECVTNSCSYLDGIEC